MRRRVSCMFLTSKEEGKALRCVWFNKALAVPARHSLNLAAAPLLSTQKSWTLLQIKHMILSSWRRRLVTHPLGGMPLLLHLLYHAYVDAGGFFVVRSRGSLSTLSFMSAVLTSRILLLIPSQAQMLRDYAGQIVKLSSLSLHSSLNSLELSACLLGDCYVRFQCHVLQPINIVAPSFTGVTMQQPSELAAPGARWYVSAHHRWIPVLMSSH